ncbi:MAG: phosphatidic acid phosphatase [Clostridia bacterium]|nr:phosphatidic acid phosphatase [Clostridia bacterium]
MVDYRALTLKTLFTPHYSHILLLLFWPLFGILFTLQEKVLPLNFHAVWCPLDDIIPFNEWFYLPYEFWFIFLIGMLVYGFFSDVYSFRRYMWFVIITYTVTAVIYLIYPTEQNLRPEVFPRDNLLVDLVKGIYAFDTNTNVCPSIHVLGSFAVLFGAWRSRHFSGIAWRISFLLMTLLISVSTVFLKQHSAVDIFVAIALVIPTWIILDRKFPPLNESKT